MHRMTRVNRARFLLGSAALLVLLVLSGARAAEARRRVVVLPLAGSPKGAELQPAVEEILATRFAVVPSEEFLRVARDLGAGSKDSDVAAISSELRLHAVIAGRVRLKGRNAILLLRVREGATGVVVDDAVVKLPTGAIGRRQAKEILAKVAKLVREANPAAPSTREAGSNGASSPDASTGTADVTMPRGEGTTARPEPTGGERRQRSGAQSSADDPPRGDPADPADRGDRGGEQQRSVQQKDTGDDSATDEELSEQKESPAKTLPVAATSAIALHVGVSFSGRKFNFDAASLPSYTSAPVPGVYLGGSLFPLAFGPRPSRLASAFGLGFFFQRALSLSTTIDVDTNKTKIGTTQQALGVDGLFRWTFGSTPQAVTTQLALGYGIASFTIDPLIQNGVNTVQIPNVSYKHVNIGLGARVPVGSPKVALLLRGGFKTVLSAGDIFQQAQFGSGSAFALDLAGGLELFLANAWAIRAEGTFTRYSLALGTGDRSQGGNVKSATDQYFGGLITLGYMR
jgi:hypothetical protein